MYYFYKNIRFYNTHPVVGFYQNSEKIRTLWISPSFSGKIGRQKFGTSPVGMSLDGKHMILTQSQLFALLTLPLLNWHLQINSLVLPPCSLNTISSIKPYYKTKLISRFENNPDIFKKVWQDSLKIFPKNYIICI